MNGVSIADLQARFDPHHRLQHQRLHLQRCIAQSQIEQRERHHQDKINLEQLRMEAQREQQNATLQAKYIEGQNARDLASHNYALGQIGQISKVIDGMIDAGLRKSEAWDNSFAQTMQQLATIEADTIRQERLKRIDHSHNMEAKRLDHLHQMQAKEQDHRHNVSTRSIDHNHSLHSKQVDELYREAFEGLQHQHQREKIILEYNNALIMRFVDSHLKNYNLTFEKACDLVFRLVERSLGMGEQQASEADVSSWVREAMAQVG
jgi:hypothetical protein